MTLHLNTAEGQSNGTALTVSNSGGGSGTAFDSITSAGTGACVFDSSTSMHGTKCYHLTGVANDNYNIIWTGNDASGAIRFYLQIHALPTVTVQQLCRFKDSSGAAIMTLSLGTNGIFTASNAASTGIKTFGTALSLDTWYRVEIQIVTISATVGQLNINYYLGDSNTVVEAGLNSAANQNLGANNIASFVFGKLQTAGTFDGRFDDIAFNPGVSTAIGPVVSAPIAVASAVQNIPASTTTANVVFNATSASSTITGATCTLVSSSGATAPTIGAATYTGLNTASCTATFPISGLVAGLHLFSCTFSDAASNTSNSVNDQINSTTVNPAYKSATSAQYTVIGGGTALSALQAAAPSTNYLQSPAPPAGASDTIVFQPLDPASVPVTFGVVGRASDGVTTLTRTVTLKQGSTTIATRSAVLTTTDSTVGGTTTTSPSGGETALITDRSALSVTYSDQ